MAPVFAYRWQCWLFCATMALLLAFPFVHKPAWMDRSVLYRAFILNSSYKYNVVSQLMQGKRDIDILFVGASTLGSGYDPTIIRDAMRKELGREPQVFVVYHPQRGADFDYMIIKDILSRRHVKLLVWEAVRAQRRDTKSHAASNFLWDYALHRKVLDAPGTDKVGVAIYSMMNAWKLLLSPVLDKKGSSFTEEAFLCNRQRNFGACLRNVPDELADVKPPEPPILPLEKMVHYRKTADEDLQISHSFRRSTQIYIDAGIREAVQHGSFVAFTQIPVMNDGNRVTLYGLSAAHKANELPILAVPRSAIFDSRMQQRQFYVSHDGAHLSSLGTQLHTRTMLPGLLYLYDLATGMQP
ncbi:MAG: hypothetical protein EBV03_03475 [Proteobacteria bacterium]|nr:hypothetical protein [Pseudomonadota bacterium]